MPELMADVKQCIDQNLSAEHLEGAPPDLVNAITGIELSSLTDRQLGQIDRLCAALMQATSSEAARRAGTRERRPRRNSPLFRGGRDAGLRTYQPWTDHPYRLVFSNGQEVEVSEPYELGFSALQALVRYCEESGREASISGRSFHFPGSTFSVKFWRT